MTLDADEEVLTAITKWRMMKGLRTFLRTMSQSADLQDMPKAKNISIRALTEMECLSLGSIFKGSRRKSSTRDYAILELAL